jgi:16S rRNA (guanine(527)-N(7))-methyltransferase RsmG
MFHVEPETGILAGVLRELELPECLLSPLQSYAALVKRDADRLGLVSEAGLEDFLARHVAESLAFALVRRPMGGGSWADIGSGAGLPGLPLAIAFPETSFTLVEPQARRAGFLELAAIELGLDNVQVAPTRAQSLRDRFDVSVTRAFSSDEASGAEEAVVELLASVTVPGGSVLVQIGRDESEPTFASKVSIRAQTVDLEVSFLSMEVSEA